jgi:hypothetical protein
VPWGFVAAAVVGAAGSAIAGHEQRQGQEQAANTQAGMFNTINQQEQPFINAGYGATKTLSELLGTAAPTGSGGMATGTNLPGGYLNQPFNPTQEQLNNYPGFQFSLDTGMQAVRNKDTPAMGALSGSAIKDLMGFNQGLAQTYYGNYFNQQQTQQQNIFNRLSQIAGLGQSAATQVGNAGTGLGTGIAQAQAAAAGSTAAGIVGGTNAIGNASTLAALMQNSKDPNNFGGGYGGPSYYGGQVDNSLSTDTQGYTYNLPGGGD